MRLDHPALWATALATLTITGSLPIAQADGSLPESPGYAFLGASLMGDFDTFQGTMFTYQSDNEHDLCWDYYAAVVSLVQEDRAYWADVDLAIEWWYRPGAAAEVAFQPPAGKAGKSYVEYTIGPYPAVTFVNHWDGVWRVQQERFVGQTDEFTYRTWDLDPADGQLDWGVLSAGNLLRIHQDAPPPTAQGMAEVVSFDGWHTRTDTTRLATDSLIDVNGNDGCTARPAAAQPLPAPAPDELELQRCAAYHDQDTRTTASQPSGDDRGLAPSHCSPLEMALSEWMPRA